MIDKPINEKRIFKYGILSNKMKYVIIQDKEDELAQVSIAVKAGSLDEPHEYMGLAHFLEHMLFLGSMKYTSESYFSEMLSAYGGSCNAYTSSFETLYYFDVINDNLKEMLDIFSRFFIDPLFDINAVNREINAINSEHMKNINNDMRATAQVLFNLSDDMSGIKHFSCGTLETLGSLDIETLRAKMIEFYNNYYCADNICLAIQSPSNIEDTEKLIIEFFSHIKNKQAIPNKVINTIKYSMTNNEYIVVPVADINYIEYFWDISIFTAYLYDKTINIIADIIKYNGINNLSSILKKLGLASNIDITILQEGIFILQICINKILPDITKVIIHINNIVKYYMNVFLQNLPWDDIYTYQINKSMLMYNYSDKDDNIDIVNMISLNLHYFKPLNVFNGNSIVIDRDISKMLELVKKLVFSNANILYITRELIDSNVEFIEEPFYSRKYGQLKKTFINNDEFYKAFDKIRYNITYLDFPIIPSKHIKDMSASNIIKYIKPVLINSLNKHIKPILINNTLIYGSTSQFDEPLTYCFIILSEEMFFNTIQSYIISCIACNAINHYIAEVFSNMLELGYNARININFKSAIISFTINGLNYRFNEFFNILLKQLEVIKVSEIIIKIIINKMIEKLKNVRIMSPWDYSQYLLELQLYKYSYIHVDQLKLIETLMTMDYYSMVMERIKLIISRKGIPSTMFIYGNILKNNIPSINLLYKPYYKLETSIPQNLSTFSLNSQEHNNLVMMILPFNNINMLDESKTGKYSYKDVAYITLLITLLEHPAYEQLRTIEQLGYLVKAGLYYDENKYYIIIKVQSILNNELVKKKMNKFIKWF